MKKVLFIMPYFSLPVDAKMGGAIEQLMNVLIEENEKNNEYKFLIISPYEVERKYKNTEIIVVKENKFSKFIRRSILYIIRKLKLKINYVTRFDKKALEIAKNMNVDRIIVEGAIPTNLEKFTLLDKSKLYMHVHYQHTSKEDFSDYFDNVISVSEFVNRDLKKSIKGKINYYVLANCLTSDNFYLKVSEEEKEELKKELGFNSDDKIILYCGRLTKVKGIDKLIDAFKLINDDSYKLLIIGQSFFKGSRKNGFLKELEKKCLDVSTRIKFTGYIHNSLLYKYYQIASLQVIPSMNEEAAGLVALEGRVSGLKQVVTNSGGISEYASKNALVVNRDENVVYNLKEAIINSFNNIETINDELEEKFTKEGYYKNFVKIVK